MNHGVKAAFFLVGFGLLAAAIWITWDWITPFVNLFTVANNPVFCSGWSFMFPLFSTVYNCSDYTLPFDYSFLLVLFGVILVFMASLIRSHSIVPMA